MRPSLRGAALAVLFVIAAVGGPAVAPAAAAGWLAPVGVSQSAGSGPQVAVDHVGDVVVAWTRNDGSNAIVQAAVRPAGGAFSAPVDLSAAGEDASAPSVAIDAAGDAVVVWTRSDGSNTIVQASSRPAGGAFSVPVDLSDAGRDASSPQVAMDAAGDAVAVWTRFNGGNTIVQAARRFAGSPTFFGGTDVSASGQNAVGPHVAMNHDGDAIVLWTQGSAVQVASSLSGSEFSWPPVDVTAAPESGSGAGVGIADDGSAVAVWKRWQVVNGQVELTVRGAIREGHGAFGAPVDLSSEPVGGGQVGLAVNGAGRAIVVWEQFTGSTAASILGVAERAPGASFAAAQDLDPDCWTPRVALDGSGGATIVCRKWDAGAGVITTQAFTRSAPGPFATPARITTSGEEGYNAAVATDAQGDAVAVYEADVIRAAVHDVTPPVLSGVIVPATATAGTPVAMSAKASDTWSPATMTFAFGDGTTATGNSVSHAYEAAGTYTVTVTATDAAGNAAMAQRTVTAVAGPAGVGDPPSGASGTPDTNGGATPPAADAPPAAEAPRVAVTPAMIAAQLRPHGATASIARLLKHGYTLSITAPIPGRIVVHWLATTGAKTTPLVVAQGTLSFPTAGKRKVKLKLTPAGRKLLAHAKKLTLTAKATYTQENRAHAVTATTRFTVKR